MVSSALKHPALDNGDRMSRDEFLSRWEQIPELKHAELIEGVVYLSSPVSIGHGLFDSIFGRWLGHYVDAVEDHHLTIVTNTTSLLGDSAFQPDIAMFRESSRRRGGGSSRSSFLEQVPELIIEITRSSRSYDLGPKLAAYRAAGVPEYIAVLLEEKRIEWRALSGTRYRLLQPGKDGMLKSARFPGLWLDMGAVFPPDSRRMKAAINLGLTQT